jgi:thymidylate kinase
VSTRTENRLRVALVGADGAGKSTVSEMLERTPLPFPVKRIYMGVNLEASTLMLPTTRLLLAAKRARGGRPDLVASSQATPSVDRPTRQVTGRSEGRRRPWRRSVKDGTRLTVWMLEEWLRQLVAAGYSSRGYIVVFDRHFYADYYHFDVASQNRRSLASRVHGLLLRHAYPKPDLVICLDAPGAVLYARKHEATPEWLEQRRAQYLQLAEVFPDFAVVDVDRPLDLVTREVATVISDFIEKRRT